jgi:tRNA-2-methylthio-N6-dimethylallyladenosine synthase
LCGRYVFRFRFMPSFYIKTYGCQMNERDSEQVAQSLLMRGYRLVGDETEADVILLNTCSVRDMAEQKAIGKMGMLQRLRERRPHLVLAYLGCMAQSRGPELLNPPSRVDLIVGTQKFHHVADYVDELLRRKLHSRMDDQRLPIVDIAEERGSQSTIRDHLMSPSQATAFVSIMQGCNMHCAFCIVPQTRGAERSRSITEITNEVRELAARGVKEVTLLGQIVNLFGRHEFEKRDGLSPFVQLLDAVCAVDGIARVRFTSPHPIGFREDLLRAFVRQEKLVEHVHLPLQSGSDRILKAMRRGYTAATYLRLVERLRQARPGIAITTDIIVGFPGETDGDYDQTRQLTDQVGFDNAFVFRYSPRRDTPAAAMDQQVAEEVKEFRNQDLLRTINRAARAKLDAYVGSKVQILCEGPSKNNPNRLTGRTRTNKIVVFEGAPRHVGQIFDVRITSASSSTLYGDPVLMEL